MEQKLKAVVRSLMVVLRTELSPAVTDKGEPEADYLSYNPGPDPEL